MNIDDHQARWLACELHTHTPHSDGKHTLMELARSAAALELDWIALTDHNTTSGLLDKEAVESETGVRILNGLEWTTFYGHMLVLGLPTGGYADWRMLGPNDLQQGLREVKALGALAGLAHPFRVGSPMCTGCYWEYAIQDWNGIDFIEVWSGTFPSVHRSNQRAYELWTAALNQGYRVTATCGRDWHASAPPGEPVAEPVAVTYVADVDGTGTGDPMAALAAGAVAISMGPLLTFTVSSGPDAAVGIGGNVPCGGPESRTAHVRLDPERRRASWALPAQPLEVRLVGSGGCAASATLAANTTSLTLPFRAAADLLWLRAELYGTMNGCRTLIAFTNAIYFESAEAEAYSK